MALNTPELQTEREDDMEGALFGLFEPIRRDNRISSVRQFALPPRAPVRPETRNLQFVLDPIAQWVMLSEIIFEIQLKIVSSTGANIDPPRRADAAKSIEEYGSCSFENGPGFSCIKSIVIRANDCLLYDSGDNYGIQSYILLMSNYTKNSLDTKWETAGVFLEKNPSNCSPFIVDGVKKRISITNGSTPYLLSCPLFTPLTLQTKALIPMTRLSVEINLVEPNMLLKTIENENFQYQVANPQLIMKKIVTNSDFQLGFEKRLHSSIANYYVENFQTISFIIDSGRSSFSIPNCFNSSFAPVKSICCINTQKSSSGDYKSSIFSFRRHNVLSCRMFINDEPCPSLEYNFQKEGILRAFRDFHSSAWGETNNCIDLGLFKDEYFFMTFDYLQLQNNSAARSKQLANVRLDIQFSAPIEENLRVYLLSISHESISVNHQRAFQRNF